MYKRQIEGNGITLLEARDPGFAIKKEDVIGMRMVRLGGGYLPVIHLGRETVPNGTAKHALKSQQLPFRCQFGHCVQPGDGNEQTPVRRRSNVVDVIEKGMRDHPPDGEGGKIAHENFRLRAKKRAISHYRCV